MFVARPLTRHAVATVAFIVLFSASGCFGGGPASGVKPPPKADGSLTARVGLVVATNSASFQRHVDASDTEGVAVLFVQEGGPADAANVERGDVITAVNGDDTVNAEIAVAQLRARPDDELELDVVRRNGDRSKIDVVARVPGRVDLERLYDPLVDDDPDDPLLLYLRAQARQQQEDFEDSIADLDRAVELDEDFSEAYNLRAERRWALARSSDSEETEQSRAREAVQDWQRAISRDQKNARAFASLSQAIALLNEAAGAKQAAQSAIKLDETLPAAHYGLALAEFYAGDNAAAAEAASEAVELNPFDVRYYEILARSFKRLDRQEDCEGTMSAILDLITGTQDRARLLRICA
jgi:Flp pilus assembly protein TadD